MATLASEAELDAAGGSASWAELFRSFTLMGWTAFGGPAAHLGLFEKEFCERRKARAWGAVRALAGAARGWGACTCLK